MSLVDLGKRLLDAAKRGETDEVRTLMSNGAPFTTDWLGTSPLHFATQYGHLQTAEVLLRAGISRDARTKVDRTPLHVAAQEGHSAIVELLLQHSADIDAKDMLKMTPLHWATEKGNIPIIETLIRQGADINSQNKFDRTPLDIALANGRMDLAQILQLAQASDFSGLQHTEISSITEGESVTIETSETLETEPEASVEDLVMAAEDIPVTGTETEVKQSQTPNKALPVRVVPNVAIKSPKTSEQSSVLATLAALAEATSTTNAQAAVSTTEAMNWLESQGITMITTTDGGIITSAVESGQTITLTEAGRIALNIIKQQGLGQTATQGTEEDSAIETVVGDAGDQKVITIVAEPEAESSDIPAVEESQVLTTITTDSTTDTVTDSVAESVQIETADTIKEIHISTEQADTEVTTEEPASKRRRVDSETEKGQGEATPLDVNTWLQEKPDSGHDDLKKQLEEVQKQAEAYKQQLQQKEKEAEDYKKRLSEIAAEPTSKVQTSTD